MKDDRVASPEGDIPVRSLDYKVAGDYGVAALVFNRANHVLVRDIDDHIGGAREQLTRDPLKFPLPQIQTENFTSLFDWNAEDTRILNYESHPRIKFEIAV